MSQHINKLVKSLFSNLDQPVGRKISCYFQKNWEALTVDPSVLNIVRGWEVLLMETPVQSRLPGEIPFKKEEYLIVDQEIQNMLAKKAIRPAESQEGQFISKLFVRPKKGGAQLSDIPHPRHPSYSIFAYIYYWD